MADTTTIEWTGENGKTWNPWLGCEPKPGHPGCLNCYAQRWFKRWGVVGKRRRTSDVNWRKPIHWNRDAAELDTPPIVLPAHCDPFENWQGPIVNAKGSRLAVAYEFGEYFPSASDTELPKHTSSRWATMSDLRRDMFALIDQTPNLIRTLLTKRPENIRPMWEFRSDTIDFGEYAKSFSMSEAHRADCSASYRPNVYLMYSASDQASLEAGIGPLLECADLVPVIGLSLEPLLGPVDLPYLDKIDWVIVGGESGPKARPCDLAWILDIIEQCKAAGVPCFVKQWGSTPMLKPATARRLGCTTSVVKIKHPKGGDKTEWPEQFRVQEYPEVKDAR